MSAPNTRPAAYAELASVVASLPVLVREKRRREGLSVRAAARQLDCSFSTLHRIEEGGDYNSRLLPALLLWIGANA